MINLNKLQTKTLEIKVKPRNSGGIDDSNTCKVEYLDDPYRIVVIHERNITQGGDMLACVKSENILLLESNERLNAQNADDLINEIIIRSIPTIKEEFKKLDYQMFDIDGKTNHDIIDCVNNIRNG